MKLFEIYDDKKPRTPAAMAFQLAQQYGRRFPAGEAIIAKNPGYALAYAEDILQGPFPLGEPAIASNPRYALAYAEDVLNNRWIMGEPAICSKVGTLREYRKFLKTKGINIKLKHNKEA